MVLLVAALAGCTQQFGLLHTEKTVVEDTGGDTAPATDSAQDSGEEESGDDTGGSSSELPMDDTAVEDPDTGGTSHEVPDSGDTGTADTGTADSGTVDDPPPEEDCTETSDLVYVLSRNDNRLYTFDPASLSVTSLGTSDCRTSQTPGSMAVSRDGYAYVRYSDDAVYAVDLATLNCSSTTYSDRRTGFDSFGMGYATNDAETWRDRLFVANGDTLGILDTASWSITNVGRMPSQSELTG